MNYHFDAASRETYVRNPKTDFLKKIEASFPQKNYMVDHGDGMVFFIYKRGGPYSIPERRDIDRLATQLGSYEVNKSGKEYPAEGISKDDILVRVFHSTDHRKMHIVGFHPAEPAVTISLRTQITPYAAEKTIRFIQNYFELVYPRIQ
jgi:hypothetical protein